MIAAALVVGLLGCLPSAEDPPSVRNWGPPPAPVRAEAATPGGAGARVVTGVTPLWPYARVVPAAAGVSVKGVRVRVKGDLWGRGAGGAWVLARPLTPGLLLTGLAVDGRVCGAPDCAIDGGRVVVNRATAPRELALTVEPDVAAEEGHIRGRTLVKSALSVAAIRLPDEPEPVLTLVGRAVQVTVAQAAKGATLRFRPRFLRSAIFAGDVAPVPFEVVVVPAGGAPVVVYERPIDPAAAADVVEVPLDPDLLPPWSQVHFKATLSAADTLGGVVVLADAALHVESP